MVFTIVLTCICSLTMYAYVSAENIIRRYEDQYQDSDNYSDNISPTSDPILDLSGDIKKYFALNAAITDPDHSVVCSPISALLPLGKLAIGADKTALRELLAALGLTEKAEIKSTFAQLISDLEYLPGVVLNIASRIYLSSTLTLNPDFERRAKKVFKAGLETIDFKVTNVAVKSVNDWVYQQTNGMIEYILSPSDISPLTSMILVNAVYFWGKWKKPFDQVNSGSFYTPVGEQKVPMMTKTGSFNYTKSDTLDAQIIEIPYKGDKASFVVILPNTKNGLPILLHALKLAPEILDNAMRYMTNTQVVLSMPKFKVETQMDLKVLYEKVGLRKIFDMQDSGLTGVAAGDSVYVSSGVHKAVIEVNERGTKAAASSVLQIAHMSGIMVNTETFQANHPFLFIVKAMGQQLFAGTYTGL